MRYATICSGIGAPEVAFQSLGWECVFNSEIEPFPSAVLAHHYPDVPNLGDFTTIGDEYLGTVDVLVGGTPCQDFSVAGLRAGMDGKRGQLTVEFARLAGRIWPRWLAWENVPGVLSIDGGRAFGTFLGLLGQLGYGFAYRVLDAQFFGVPQRRRRVFVVGHLGDWRRAAAVLFERHSLSGHPAPSREARKGTADSFTPSSHGSYAAGVGSLRANGGDLGGVSETLCAVASTGEISHCLNAGGMGRQDYETETLIAFSAKDHGADNCTEHHAVSQSMAVRRLTPRECERLQGFPDDYTLIPFRNKAAADGPRYKALGNSMAVPVLKWLGERIAMVDAL